MSDMRLQLGFQSDSLLLDEAVFSPSLDDHEVSVFIFDGAVTDPVPLVVVVPSRIDLPLRSLCLFNVRRLASVKASPLSDVGCLFGSDSSAASISQSRPLWKVENWSKP